MFHVPSFEQHLGAAEYCDLSASGGIVGGGDDDGIPDLGGAALVDRGGDDMKLLADSGCGEMVGLELEGCEAAFALGQRRKAAVATGGISQGDGGAGVEVAGGSQVVWLDDWDGLDPSRGEVGDSDVEQPWESGERIMGKVRHCSLPVEVGTAPESPVTNGSVERPSAWRPAARWTAVAVSSARAAVMERIVG